MNEKKSLSDIHAVLNYNNKDIIIEHFQIECNND